MDNNVSFDEKEYFGKSFKNLTFCNEKLQFKNFEECIFHNCNFSETVFKECKFRYCKFINCNLSLISIAGSTFLDILFDECKAIGITGHLLNIYGHSLNFKNVILANLTF